jgi:hypothetical protein
MTYGTEYPAPEVPCPPPLGLYPIDFMLEAVLKLGLQHFRQTPDLANRVYGHLLSGPLSRKYGQSKIDEIREYINSTDIGIIQGFPMTSENSPTISLNLNDGSEDEKYSGLDNFGGELDTFGSDGSVVARENLGYATMRDTVIIGIHAIGGPDKTKYLYYLIAYILIAYKEQLEERGLTLSTFQATDLSRLNDYLPEGMFSRFITFSALTTVKFKKADAPIINEFSLNIKAEGV